MNLNEYKILEVLNRVRKPVFFRELSKMSGVSIGGTQQVVKVYSRFLDKKTEGRNTYYFFKEDIGTLYLRKIIEFRKAQVFLEQNPQFKEFFGNFVEEDIPCIIFGGYAKGRANKNSDIDVLVLSSKKISEHLCPVELHAVKLSKVQFESAFRKKERLIKEILNNYIIINGVDYFKRFV